jgi:hypothetical protein
MQSLNRQKSERPRRERDFYETPIELAEESIRVFATDFKYFPSKILDPGSGNGIWGKAVSNVFFPKPDIFGVEVQNLNAKYGEYYSEICNGDYLSGEFDNSIGDFDFIVGNPPYSLAEEFIRKSFSYLIPNGYIFFLLRLAFLESQKRYKGLFKEFPPLRVYVSSRRPSFFSTTKGKTTDTISYAMFLWKKGYRESTDIKWFMWNYD